MSHDCSVEVQVNLKESVTEEMVIQALTDWLDEQETTYEDEVESGNIEFVQGSLFVGMDFSCSYGGGYTNESMDNLEKTLSPLCSEPCWFVMKDHDAPSGESSVTPYFLGNSDTDKKTAQILYGLSLMKDWVEPIVGPEAFQNVKEGILSIPLA